MYKLMLCSVSLALLSMNAMGGDQCLCTANSPQVVGWCGSCKHGLAYTHEAKSEKLITALQGQDVDPAKLGCPGCKKAAEGSGACCGKQYVGKKSYTSPVSAAMAKGTVPDESKVSCPACKASLKTGQGYCDHCKVGVLHGVAYSSKADYDAAVKADAILVRAILAANSCEGCAVAMVTDGECSHCKMSFKDGQPKKS